MTARGCRRPDRRRESTRSRIEVCRHVQSQRLPVVAIVERKIYGRLVPANSRPLRTGIFADRVDRGVVGQPADDLRPGLAASWVR